MDLVACLRRYVNRDDLAQPPRCRRKDQSKAKGCSRFGQFGSDVVFWKVGGVRVVRWWDYGVIVLRRLPTRILCRGSAWISQQAVATHTQRTSGNLEDLHFTLLDVVVDGASVCIDNLCGGRYSDDLHVLTTTGAPDLLPLYQRMVCFNHVVA